ncbi:MAG: ketoacyl-ACP synthase III [Rhodococcus sp.]|nr:ketoacyl-ACP synthase III [Rhodococcus sp. (in: high G+C Gram-positive bacteria)]
MKFPHNPGTYQSQEDKLPITVTGVGSCLPRTVETNEDLAQQIDTSDEWIRSRTGIGQRWIAAEDESTSTMATRAARRALESAALDRVDLIVVATSTPDRSVPATAPLVGEALGMSGVAAFDLNAVCTGFVYALSVANAMLATSSGDIALVIGADTFSSILDPKDRSTRAIFGDGAGAVVITRSDMDDASDFELGSDGGGYDLITRPASGSAIKRDEQHALPPYFTMAGKSVFMQAVARMTESCTALLDRARLSVDDVDAFVAHQANARILGAVVDQLGIRPEKSIQNIDRVGNTVAASIPIALAEAHAKSQFQYGDRLLLTAFGGGLTWGACLAHWQVNTDATSKDAVSAS